jgi:leucyl-tRNA synthetase
VVPLPEKDLPLKLPEVEHYEPSGTGESPLAKIKSWVEVKCPHCGGRAKRETNTMPQWAGSSWYYLRFMDPHNNWILVAAEKEQYWGPVDFYVGGAEHATRHLIYARFWHKFLYDLGIVSTQEPFKKLQHVGLILAEDGRKMSKRWGNVINPDEIVTKYGADSMRVYEMFMAPFGSASAWKMQGVVGCRKFLVKVWQLWERVGAMAKGDKLGYETLLHQTIKKVARDIDEFKLNTTVSCLMILVNKMTEAVQVRKEDFKILIQLLSPLAPHLAEELWSDLGNKRSVFLSRWPEYNRDLAKAEMVILPIQINGKLRDQLEVEREVIEQEEKIWELVLAREKVKQYVKGVKVKKKIYVKGRIVNLVVE